MKRYPKHARPLWGVAKRRRPICYVYGPTTVTVRGLDIDGNEVVETSELPSTGAWTSRVQFASLTAPIVFTQSKMRADLKIKVSFGPDETPAAGTIVMNADGSAASYLPPVEVRL